MRKIRWRMKKGIHRAIRRLDSEGNNIGWEKFGAPDVVEKGRLLFKPGDIALVPDNEELEPARWDRLDRLPDHGELEAREPQPKVRQQIVNKGRGYYDVVNPETGAKLNDKSLRLQEALDIVGVEYAEEQPE